MEEIDFSILPVKCTHDSGSVVIFKRGETDIGKARKILKKSLRTDYYLRGREWPYKEVKRRIVAEEFMQDGDGKKGLVDYKFMCFNGKPEILMVCTDRTEIGAKMTFFDMNWNRLPFERHYPSDHSELIRP